jgi:hypothetical protein
VNYATPEAFRTALEHRLAKTAASEGRSIAHARKMVVFDRVLARLQATSPDRWILQGGVALEFRLRTGARPTLDLDLARRDDEQSALRDLFAAARHDLGDSFTFEIQRISAEVEDDISTIRFRAIASLAGSVLERLPQLPSSRRRRDLQGTPGSTRSLLRRDDDRIFGNGHSIAARTHLDPPRGWKTRRRAPVRAGRSRPTPAPMMSSCGRSSR